MAKILLIETASEVCSAAISVDGEVVSFFEAVQAQSHTALLTLQIDACCRKSGISLAQLDAVALSQGPGAYTALRVGASAAKGICYALEKPLIAVDTLLALAAASRTAPWSTSATALSPTFSLPMPGNPIYAPMLDARRQEVWLALYDANLLEIAPVQPLILENNSFEKLVDDQLGLRAANCVVLSGNGMKKTGSGVFSEKFIFSTINKCSARHLATLADRFFQEGDFQDVAYFEPVYMKPPNITTPSKPMF